MLETELQVSTWKQIWRDEAEKLHMRANCKAISPSYI